MAKKRPNKEQRDLMAKMSDYGCVACHMDGVYNKAEIHHIRKHTGMGLKPSHFDILPLCPAHHRTGKISVHLGKKAFEDKYGSEQNLAKIVRERISEWDIIQDIF